MGLFKLGIKAAGMFGSGGLTTLAEGGLRIVEKFTKDKDLIANLSHDERVQRMTVEYDTLLAEIGFENNVLDLEKTAREGVAAQNLADANSNDQYQRRWRPKASLRLVNLLVGVIVTEYALDLIQMIWFPDYDHDFGFKYTFQLMVGVFGLLGFYFGSRTLEKVKDVVGK